MKVLDLFSGIGGFSLGLERTGGFQTVAFCEIDPYCRRVLAKHWPEVPCYDDVRMLTAERLNDNGIRIDAICGGFPCQDISDLGEQAGIGGARSGLWREYARLIGEIRPRVVLVENVAALLGRGMGIVLGDLSSLGYDAEWSSVSACAMGAPHTRDRVWIIAYPAEVQRLYGLRFPWVGAIPHANPDWSHWRREQWPEAEPKICRVDDGVPDRVSATEALGNAVVPQIPEMIGRAIMESALWKPTETGNQITKDVDPDYNKSNKSSSRRNTVSLKSLDFLANSGKPK